VYSSSPGLQLPEIVPDVLPNFGCETTEAAKRKNLSVLAGFNRIPARCEEIFDKSLFS
jgi:hypothetical protein